MRRVAQTIALATACLALVVSLLNGCSFWETLKRAGIAYVVFFFLTGVLALIFRAGVLAETRPGAPDGQLSASGKKGPPSR